MKKIIGVLFVIIVISFSGCKAGIASGNSSKDPYSSDKEMVLSDPSAHTNDSVLEAMNGGEIQTITAKLKDGRPWAPLSIIDEGVIYGFTSSTDQAASQILSYNIKSGKVDILYTAEKGFQPSDFFNNEGYLLWNEYRPPNPTGPIKIMLYNKKDKKAKVLNNSLENVELNTVQIAFGNDLALWSEGTSEGENIQRTICQYDFKSGSRSTLKNKAMLPAIGINFIAWIGPETDTSVNGAVFVEDLVNHSVRKITDTEEAPSELAAFGDNLVYSGYSSLDYLDPKKKVYENELVLYTNGKKKLIEKSTDHEYGSPQISASSISWYENSATRIYNIQDDKIYTLQTSYGEAFSCGSYVMWTTADPAETKEQAIKDGMYTMTISVIKI